MDDQRSAISSGNLVGEQPHRSVLRMLLRKLVRTDSELNALCLDYFPDAYGHFADGMNRLSKVNLLLELTEPAVVLEGLRKWCKGTQDSHSAVDQALAGREPEDVQRRSELREKLEELYLLREQQRLLGQDLSQLDSQIVAIKRKQRQSPQLQEGEVLDDRYRLIEVIGRGGFGRVWQAFDRTDRRLVAVKVLHVDQGDDPRRSERFIRGARQMKALQHPHIVRVLDGPAEYHGFHYFVMDYLPGGDLSQAVSALAIDLQGALRAILAIGDALAYAHERHLIHRDIKPQNILLDGQGSARLTDFDLVWAADTTGGTATGFLGTHVYVAPEQAEDAKSIDERADLYALAMTTLFVLHGRSLPLHAVYKRALFIDALNCSEPARALLRQATAIEADDRPASVTAYCRELNRCFADLLTPSLPLQPAALPRAELTDIIPPAPSSASGTSPSLTSWPAEAHAQRTPRIPRPMLAGLLGAVVMLCGLGGTIWWLNRPAPDEAESDAAKLLVDVDSDMQNRRWTDAIVKSNRVINNSAFSAKTHERATVRRGHADEERRVQSTFERFLNSGDNYDQALALYREIPPESVYHASARENYDRVFPLFVEKHIQAAEDARALGRCADFRAEVKLVLDLDSKQIKALAAKDRPCGEKSGPPSSDNPIASNAPEHHRLPRPIREKPTVSAPEPAEAPTAKVPEANAAEADQTLSNAQTEYVNGNFSQAISIAKSVQRINPTRAWRIIGAAACNMKNVKLATEAHKHLDSASRQYLVHTCWRQGIIHNAIEYHLNEQ